MNQYIITLKTDKTEKQVCDWLNRHDLDEIDNISISSDQSGEVIAQSDWKKYQTICHPFDRIYIDTNTMRKGSKGNDLPYYAVEVYSYRYRITSIGQSTNIALAFSDAVQNILAHKEK